MKNKLKLEKAARSDIPLITRLQRKAFMPLYEKYRDAENPANATEESISERFSQPNSTYFLIKLEDEIIGAARVVSQDEFCDLKQIFILPEYQGNSYAQKAIFLLEDKYPKAKTWKLDTIKQEEKLCHLYSKMGYVLTGREDVLSDNMTIVYFEKKMV